MLRLFGIVLLIALSMLSACGPTEVVVYSTTINVPPDMNHSAGDQYGDVRMTCTTVAALHHYLDTGYVSNGCAVRPITVLRERGTYRTNNSRYDISEFMSGNFQTYYTFDGPPVRHARVPDGQNQRLSSSEIEELCTTQFPRQQYRDWVECVQRLQLSQR